LLCFAMLCFALVCFALLCFAMLCFALIGYAMLCFALPCLALLNFVLLWFGLLIRNANSERFPMCMPRDTSHSTAIFNRAPTEASKSEFNTNTTQGCTASTNQTALSLNVEENRRRGGHCFDGPQLQLMRSGHKG